MRFTLEPNAYTSLKGSIMIRSPDEFLALRSSDLPEEYLRTANDSAPDDVWMMIIERYPPMRKWVAHNKTISLAILEILAQDREPDVRFVVAGKRKVSTPILEKLAKDPDPSVRHQVVYNKKTPSEVLQQLACDQEEFVASAARNRIAELTPVNN